MPSSIRPQPLPRGGLVVCTSRGPVQFGVPPETIKDSMLRPHGVPGIYVLTREFFSATRGVSLAEMEFPIYFNFFVRKRKVRVVGTASQRCRLKVFMRESMFGPAVIDLSREIDGDPTSKPWYPTLAREVAYFRAHPFQPGRQMEFEDVLEFHALPNHIGASVDLDGLRIERNADRGFLLKDLDADAQAVVPGTIRLPPRVVSDERRVRPFTPPDFGVTVLGSGHGFDPHGKTTGFVLWIGGRGILVDPPVDSTEWLREHHVPSRCIDSIILTHCHSDHDAGTMQKALQADRVRLYTTHTVHESFLRKAEAITGLEAARFGAILDFHPVPIRREVRINGARFRFFYTLHSIPTVGFEVWFRGRSLVYTADTLNDAAQIKALAARGILSPGRAEALLDFPWHHDLIIHEAGVPPLHTPIAALAALPDDVKSRLYVVHTTPDQIPPESGLRIAPAGDLDQTLRVEVPPSERSKVSRYLQAMAAVDHFCDLPPNKAVEFLDIITEVSFAPGEDIIRKGDPGDRFFMILEGQCAIVAGEVARKVFIMFDYFGESSLVRGTPRTADVKALTHTTLLAIGKDDFLCFIAGTDIPERMQRLFINREHHTWSLMDAHPLLSTLNSAQRNALQSFLEHDTAAPGAALVARGDADCVSVFVASGRVEVCRGDGGVLVEGGAATLVTDVRAVTEGRPAPFAVYALDQTEYFRLPRAAFKAFLNAFPGVYLALLHDSE